MMSKYLRARGVICSADMTRAVVAVLRLFCGFNDVYSSNPRAFVAPPSAFSSISHALRRRALSAETGTMILSSISALNFSISKRVAPNFVRFFLMFSLRLFIHYLAWLSVHYNS